MARGGRILAATHAVVRDAIRPGISTLQLDTIAEDFIRSHDGAMPAFKGLYGFSGQRSASHQRGDRARHPVAEARS